MMSTRRSLFVFGALLAVGVLLAPLSASAQIVLTATQANAGDDVTLSWSAGNTATATGFGLYWQVGGAIDATSTTLSPMVTLAAGATTYDIPVGNLQTETTYTFAVRASGQTAWPDTDQNGDHITFRTQAAAPPTVLEAPTGFSATTGDAEGEVDLMWNARSGATGYMVRWRQGTSGAWTLREVTDGTATTTTIDSLASGMSYNFQIATRNTAGTGAYTGSQSATAGSAPVVAVLAPPSSFTVTSGTAAGSVTATWTAVTGATGYSIQSRPSNSTAWTPHTVSGGTTTTATISDLTIGMMYYFRIATTNAAGTGDYTTDNASAEPGTGPAAVVPSPRSVYLTPSGRDEIIISWSHGLRADNTEDPTRIRYDVGWTDAAGNVFQEGMLSPQTIVPVPGGRAAKSYTLTNLKVDQSYLVAVRAVSGDVSGKQTAVGDWTYGTDSRQDPANYTPRQRTPDRTGQPQGVEVNGSDESLTVTWRKDDNANNYLVEWRQRNQSYDNPNQQMMVAQPSSGTTVEAVIDDLPNWWTYRVRVTSRNERGPSTTNVSEYKSTPSAEATDATRDTDYWAAPNPVEAVAGDSEVMVKWTAVEDATGYRVQWRTASQSYDSSRQHDGFYQYRSGDLQLNHTVDKLDNGTEYMFRVFAKFGDGDMSQPSDEVKATPMVPTPALPVFGALVLGAGLVAAGRRRLRARRLLQERRRPLLKA